VPPYNPDKPQVFAAVGRNGEFIIIAEGFIIIGEDRIIIAGFIIAGLIAGAGMIICDG
jgi:hypothetical protein